MDKQFYITTTLPYVNSNPHIGFAMEIIRADIIARKKKIEGFSVFFNTGTDEHGVKIYRKAKEQNIDVQKYVDGYADKFRELIPALGIMPEINFIRTTDPHHIIAAQEFWKLVDKNGLIYKKNYSIKYCVGCELEKTESELVDNRCPLHHLQELEIIEEENYFFRFSIFQKQLLDLYKNNDFVVPYSRLNEIRAFVERGLEDFSISRLSSKMPWGIPVPGDDKQVMYVWFDALVNYISATGWPCQITNKAHHDVNSQDSGKVNKPCLFDEFWIKSGGVVQYCGKDNLRQQAAMWQAMLIGAKLPPSKQIIINGFITGEGGIKMSKSLGNTIDPFEIVNNYGSDALRYYVSRELSPFEDSPFTLDKFRDAYNAHLANGLGNLISRALKMAETNLVKFDPDLYKAFCASKEISEMFRKYEEGFKKYDLQSATDIIWELISSTDKIIQERQPFKKIKTDEIGAKSDIKELLVRIKIIGELLLPIMPATSVKINELVLNSKMPAEPLFVRK